MSRRRSPTRAARCGWAHSRPGSSPAVVRSDCVRHGQHFGATSASLRVQQCLSPAIRGPWDALSAGTSPDGSLVEIVELRIAPVVCRRPVPSRIQIEADPAHPLFAGFVGAAVHRHASRGERVEEGIAVVRTLTRPFYKIAVQRSSCTEFVIILPSRVPHCDSTLGISADLLCTQT